jgi:glycerol-3-phosphate acyltransferase PlsX
MKIALDAMGGDFAPDAIVAGAKLVLPKLSPGFSLVLVGDQSVIKAKLAENGISESDVEIVHASSVIDMGEHPAKAFATKQDSSIAVGFGLLAKGYAQGFCSAGNTGAMMVGAMLTIKAIPGIIRPAIAGYVPKADGREGTLLDVGANADCKPEMLAQFAEIGSLYAKLVMKIDDPKVGLMNLGHEEQKGNLLTLAAYQLIASNPKVNFAGNIEGRDIFNEKADVIICDGFTGNVVTKMAEHLYEILHSRGVNDSFMNKMNYETVGGSPIIGVNGNVVIGHGVSSPLAIENLVLQTERMIKSNLHEELTEAFKVYI